MLGFSGKFGLKMADHDDHSDKKEETLIEKITEKFGGDDSSSSSDSDSEKKKPASSSTSSVKDKIFRLFGRERPVHQVFGGGKRRFTRLTFYSVTIVCIFFL